jgi:hypothetical protein
MTPIEHQVLCVVKACLEASQRPGLAYVAASVGKGERQTARYIRRLEEQGYLVPHAAWLRVPTALGMQAIARGPDEHPKKPGRPRESGLSHASFVFLFWQSFGRDRSPRENPHLRWANLGYLADCLRAKGLIALVESPDRGRDWAVTEEHAYVQHKPTPASGSDSNTLP